MGVDVAVGGATGRAELLVFDKGGPGEKRGGEMLRIRMENFLATPQSSRRLQLD